MQRRQTENGAKVACAEWNADTVTLATTVRNHGSCPTYNRRTLTSCHSQKHPLLLPYRHPTSTLLPSDYLAASFLTRLDLAYTLSCSLLYLTLSLPSTFIQVRQHLSHESRTVSISFHAVSNCYCLTSMSHSLLLFVGLTTFA
jgi:hypothetical protein